MDNDKNVSPPNQSGNMYSYQEEQKNQKELGFEEGAIKRSLGERNPNFTPEYQINNNIMNDDRALHQNSIVIQVDQSPPLYWMLFASFLLVQIIVLIFFAIYYDWDTLNHPNSIDEDNDKESKEKIKKSYVSFQEINIVIFLGFGFLRSFLKHYSWTSLVLTFIGGILSFEFGLFLLICWSSIFQKKWSNGIFNFEHLLNANYCSASIIISLGAVLGKLTFPQYFIMIFIEVIFSTFNFILLRQKLKIIDIGGALTVHLFGSLFGGIFSLISSFKNNEKERIRNSPHLGSNYNSNIFALFGCLILITYWPSFNTSLIEESTQKSKGIINTYLSILGSIVGTFCISPICNQGKIKIKDIVNSFFSGGIIIAGCCHIIDKFWLSILIGVICGGLTTFLCNILSYKLNEKGYHDTSDIFFYHGIPGFLGGIITTIFVGNLTKKKEEDKIYKNDIYPYVGTLLNITFIEDKNAELNISEYAGIHFGSIFITIAVSIASAFLAGFIINICNCYLALRYFNDSELFNVNDSEPFPWDDERVELQVRYNSRLGT